MGLRTAKILQAFFVFMLAWYVYSVIGGWHWLLAFVLVLIAVGNAATVWMLRENQQTIARLCRTNFIRRYVELVCYLTGQRVPLDERPGASLDALLLRTPRDFAVAGDRAKQIVRGHDNVIDDMLERVAANMTLRKRRKSSKAVGLLASFLLVGDEGVGKRYTARVVSKLLYRTGRTEVFICDRLNVGELTGNKQQPGDLLELVRREPCQTLVFENVDKASPEVTAVLTQLMTSGELAQPGSEAPVSFRNVILVATAAMPEAIKSLERTDFAPPAWHQKVIESLRDDSNIHGALLNGFDEVLVCEPPSDLVKSEVVSLLMKKECRAHGIDLSHVDPEIVATQVMQIKPSTGFSLVLNQIKKLLSRPLLAAAAGQHDELSLRVRSSAAAESKLLVNR